MPLRNLPVDVPEALCFDAFGTLFDTESAARRLRGHAEAPAGLADSAVDLWREKQLQYTYLLALMDDYRPFDAVTRDALDYAVDYYGLDLPEDVLDAVADAYGDLDPYPDAEPALAGLEDAGFRLAVLSNGAPHTLDALVASAGVADQFEAVISADEVGTYKPHPAVYENAADRLDLPLRDCWLVSGNAWDVAGAASAGMGVAWVDRDGDPPERVGGAPDTEVDSFASLVDALA